MPLLGDVGSFPYEQKTPRQSLGVPCETTPPWKRSPVLVLPKAPPMPILAHSRTLAEMDCPQWQETKRFGCSSDAMRWLLRIIHCLLRHTRLTTPCHEPMNYTKRQCFFYATPQQRPPTNVSLKDQAGRQLWKQMSNITICSVYIYSNIIPNVLARHLLMWL